jgi:hypothetical protein
MRFKSSTASLTTSDLKEVEPAKFVNSRSLKTKRGERRKELRSSEASIPKRKNKEKEKEQKDLALPQ